MWLAGKGGGHGKPPKPTPTPTPTPSPTPTPTPALTPTPTPTPTPSGAVTFTSLYGTAPAGTITVDRPVLVDADVTVHRVEIVAGGELTFPPDTSRTVTVDNATVLVEPGGQLTLTPSTPAVTHLMRWVNIDETAYGGGDANHHTDPGLVIHGRMLAKGAPKVGWARATGSLAAGAQTIDLDRDPTGWRAGDEITVTPTASPNVSGFDVQYDTRTVLSVSGRTVTVAALTYGHPSFTDQRTGQTYGAEVLNLTRNVRLEGTPGRRSHAMWHGLPEVTHTQLRHMGPRKPTGELDFTTGVLGRYPLHIHHATDTSRGALIEGVVVRDSGNRAFIPHDSNGVTFRDCIAHDVYDEAYWWDPVDPDGVSRPSHDTLWDGCVASLLRSNPTFRGYRLAGFVLGNGSGSTVTNSVAVGVQGNNDASGFTWPEDGERAVWTFHHNVSHNNACHGIFTWQNDIEAHNVTDFVCYRNGAAGISHGAYVNTYHYARGTCAGNGQAAFLLHSVNHPNASDRDFELTDMWLDGNGRPQALELTKHSLNASASPTVVTRAKFTGYTTAAVAQTYTGADQQSPDVIDLTDCTYTGPHADISQSIPGSQVREITNGVVTQTWSR